MPTPKKPSKRAPARTAARSTSRATAGARKTARKAVKPAKKATTPRRAATPRSRPTRRAAAPKQPQEEIVVTPTDGDEPIEEPGALRPIAVGRAGDAVAADAADRDEVPSVFTPLGDAPDEQPPQAPGSKPVIDRPFDEMLTGIAAAVLAVSVFLPWYKHATSFTDAPTYSGWASGTWGPVIFFLALVAVAIVALRRAGVALSFPVEHPFVLEAVGWVSVAGILLKRYFPASVGEIKLGTAYGLWVALVAAVVTALLAGRVSRDLPVVLLPGWFRSQAGKIGAGMIAVALAAGAAFGFTNSAEEALLGGNRGGSGDAGQTTTEQGLPRCAEERNLPIPEGVTAVKGSSSDSTCFVLFSSELSVRKAFNRFTKALRDAGWTFERMPGDTAELRQVAITGPQCGTLYVAKEPADQKATSIVLSVSPQLCAAMQSPPAVPRSD